MNKESYMKKAEACPFHPILHPHIFSTLISGRLSQHTPLKKSFQRSINKGRKVSSLLSLGTDLESRLRLGISTVGHIMRFVQKGKKKEKKTKKTPRLQSAKSFCKREQLRKSFPHLWSQLLMSASSTQ